MPPGNQRHVMVSITRRLCLLGVCLGAALRGGTAANPMILMDVETESARLDAEGAIVQPWIQDPVEPLNRGSYWLTRGAVDAVGAPLAQGWNCVVPAPGRRSLNRAARNLAFPVRLASLLLQGRLADCGQETGHFLVNSTLGIAGLLDPASCMGIPTYSEDVGQAFGTWGIGTGAYVFIPLLGPSSIRDGVGKAADWALNPATYVPGLGGFLAFNSFSLNLEPYRKLTRSQRDVYAAARTLWCVKRQSEVDDYRIPAEAYAAADADRSLALLVSRPASGDFAGRSIDRKVLLPHTGKRLPYSLWLQRGAAPLVCLVPGIGADRKSNAALILAEMLHAEGCSVVSIGSVFHAEFLTAALTNPFPAYTPADAADVYKALAAIVADIERRHPGRANEVRLAGYSLGGIQALFIAAWQDRQPEDGLRFASVTAINPPVDAFAAAIAFDRFFRVPLQWAEAERQERLRELALRLVTWAQGPNDPSGPLPFRRDESQFLVGLGGRDSLAVAAQAGRFHDRAAKLNGTPPNAAKNDIADVAGTLSFRRYLREMVEPYFLQAHPGTSIEELTANASLRAIASDLGAPAWVRVVTNADDFVLGEDGAAWLRATFGPRLALFPRGGHLGNLTDPEFQEAIRQAVGSRSETPR